MGTRSFRVITTLISLVLGVTVIVALSLAGKKSQGPIETFLSNAGSAVQKVENKVIVEARQHRRADDLNWLKPYMNDPALLKKPTIILMGAYDNKTTESFESVIGLEDSLKTKFPLIHIYTAWGSKSDEQFPREQVDAIFELGSIPVITWEPWLTDFDAKNFPNLRPVTERDKGGLADIAKGAYDSYLKKWATAAKDFSHPIFLRVGHEMNDPYRYPWGPQNNSAKDFIAAWQHIHQVFIKIGATNVIWVWSPHPAYGFFDAFYPGNEYVDYVGIGALNYGTVASWSKWWTFQEIFGNHYNEMTVFKKPIMITEFGSLAIGGNQSKWFANALAHLPQNYPAVKSILFFHYSEDQTTTQQPVNWYIKDDSLVTRAIIKEMNSWPAEVKPVVKN